MVKVYNDDCFTKEKNTLHLYTSSLENMEVRDSARALLSEPLIISKFKIGVHLINVIM